MNNLTAAVIVTLIFSVGVGVLFIKTLVEMVELFFNSEVEEKSKQGVRNK